MRTEKRSRGARRRRDGVPNETFKRGEWNPIEHRRRARRRRRRRAAHAEEGGAQTEQGVPGRHAHQKIRGTRSSD